MPAISIITPVYNVEVYLRKCIDSILNQTFTDFELFIVDDGSTDSCGVIADEYAAIDSRVYAIHKQNGGAPSARNAGLARASGKYLYFPDSDDWIEPTYLQDMFDIAEKTQAQLVISGYTMEYYESGSNQSYSILMPERCYPSKDIVRNNLHKYFDNMMIAVPWNKLYRSDYICNNKILFPDLKWDDLHFNMEVIMDIERVAVSESSGYHFFRSRRGSETFTVFDGLLYKKRREQFEHILKVYNHWNILDSDIIRTIYGYYVSRLVQCVQEISVSNSFEKRKLINEILKDRFNNRAMERGKISSKLLMLAAVPLKMKNVTACIVMGKIIGHVKKNNAAVFYALKSMSVNKATKLSL